MKQCFCIADELSAQVCVPEALHRDLNIAESVLMSKAYSKFLVSANIIKRSQQKLVLEKMKMVQFEVNLIYTKKDMDAYACVYRESSSNEIYTNPLLLSKLAREEFVKQNLPSERFNYINNASRFLLQRSFTSASTCSMVSSMSSLR